MIVAGFGFTTSATLESFRDALSATGQRPDALATAADKVAGLEPFARAEALPCLAVEPANLEAQKTTTQSTRAHQHRGTGSVAEAAALAAAGPGAALICARVISADRQATCALAREVPK